MIDFATEYSCWLWRHQINLKKWNFKVVQNIGIWPLKLKDLKRQINLYQFWGQMMTLRVSHTLKFLSIHLNKCKNMYRVSPLAARHCCCCLPSMYFQYLTFKLILNILCTTISRCFSCKPYTISCQDVHTKFMEESFSVQLGSIKSMGEYLLTEL